MANHTEPRSVIEGVIPTPKMPPSLQSLPNELKQQIAANLIVPLDDPNSSLTLLYPPRHNQLIDTSSILALRLVSKDMRDNAATTFETVISEICIGPHESSLDRFVKISEDPYFKQHIRHITFSSGISNLNGIYHPSQLHQYLRSHYLYELIESFCNNEHRMLFSGIYTLKIVRGLSNLTRCDSITISGGQWSLESTRLIQSVYGAIDAATDAVFGHGLFIKDLREGESQILSAVCHAVSNSRIRLQELNIYCHERTSALMDVFDEDRLDTATFGPQFSQLSTLKVQIPIYPGIRPRIGFINAIPSVRDLTLSLSAGENRADHAEQQVVWNFLTHNFAQGLSLPNLNKLSLGLFGFYPDFISTLISDHHTTLRTLQLGVIGFEKPEDWTWFLRSLVGKQDLEQLSIISPWARLPDGTQRMLPELESFWKSTRSSSSHVGIDDSLQHVANQWESQWAKILHHR